MTYIVAAILVLVIVVDALWRARNERRMRAEFKVYVAEASSDLLKRFTEAINAAMDAESKRVDDVLKLDRLNIEKALKSIRVSYATLFQGFVAHADAYHLRGNNKIPWTNLAPLRPIAAIAKMMKAQQALKDYREKNPEEPDVPESVHEEGAEKVAADAPVAPVVSGVTFAGDVKVEGEVTRRDDDPAEVKTPAGV